MANIIPKCKNPSCNNNAWFNTSKNCYYDHCSKSCSQAYSIAPCVYPKCTKNAFFDQKTNKYSIACSKTHYNLCLPGFNFCPFCTNQSMNGKNGCCDFHENLAKHYGIESRHK